MLKRADPAHKYLQPPPAPPLLSALLVWALRCKKMALLFMDAIPGGILLMHCPPTRCLSWISYLRILPEYQIRGNHRSWAQFWFIPAVRASRTDTACKSMTFITISSYIYIYTVCSSMDIAVWCFIDLSLTRISWMNKWCGLELKVLLLLPRLTSSHLLGV